MIASLAPSGRFMAEDLHRAGGTASLIRELVRGGHIDGAAPTVDGADAGGGHGERDGARRRGALHARGAVQGDGRVARAAREPRAGRQPREARGEQDDARQGPARVFDSEEACTDAVRAGDVAAGRRARRPLRGAGRRPRDARDAERHRVGRRRRARRVGRARHGRAVLGRDARADGRPCRARGGARRPARRRPRRRP